MSTIPRPGPDDEHNSSSNLNSAATTRAGAQTPADLRTTAANNSLTFAHNAALPPSVDTSIPLPHRNPIHMSPASAGLSIRTNVDAQATAGAARYETPTISYGPGQPVDSDEGSVQQMASSSHSSHLPTVDSSLRSNVSMSSLTSSLSPGSHALHSPYLAAMADLTPLPSPIGGSENLWRRRQPRTSIGSLGSREDDPSLTSPDSPTKRKKSYGSLMQEAAVANASSMAGAPNMARSASHTRNRSISDFVPERQHNVRPRHVTIGEGDAPSLETPEYQMQREAHLATQRGLTATAPPAMESSKQLSTPPPSSSSVPMSREVDEEPPHLEDGTPSDFLEIHCGIQNKRRKFRPLRQLGQGTFSTVVLATRENITAHPTPEIEPHLDPRKLVAVKIVEHGPAGGADQERIETSLKREVEILKSISHASLVHLKACEHQASRSLLVLSYCPGGDLFDLASQKRELLTPPVIQRMFAELVGAVRYLHSHHIVHRDIKLENVLVNLCEPALKELGDPTTHPTPIVTLTDLGLSRRLPEPPESPLLTTRCGSEDYAAPEILLGQPYDGRLTDAWALGVLLYALMEGRLPFDAPPSKPDRSRNTHRIARCDWIWCRFGDEDGDWDPARGNEFDGAQLCVEGLLKKVRMGRKPLEEIEKLAWVQEGIKVDGGLQAPNDDDIL